MLRSMNLKSLNPHISCVLCGGYLVDATTIIECLHSFCRSCIILWLEKSYKCPVCETEIHKTRPYLNIRPDRVLQDIVYKLIPGLYDNELSRRKEFDADLEREERERRGAEEEEHNDEHSKDKKTNDVIDDPVCVTMEYYGRKRFWKEEMVFPTRYLRCSALLPVKVLKKFVVMKFGIPDSHFVEIIRCDEILSDHLSLKELWRIYGLHNKSFIDLQYIIIDKKLDSEISQQTLEEPKFKKIIRKRKRRRKTAVATSANPAGISPIKRKRRRRVVLAVRRNTKSSNGNTAQLVKETPVTTLDSVSEQAESVDTVLSPPGIQKIEHLENNLAPDKPMQADICVDTYACPATPESDADHNDCVSPTGLHNVKNLEALHTS